MTAEVPADLLANAQALLAREGGIEALQAMAANINPKMACTAVPSETKKKPDPQCPQGHTLKRQQPGMTDWISGVKCDSCGGSAYQAGDMWSCRDCDYDECGLCAARPECPAGHRLKRKNAGITDWISGMTCDVCSENPWKSGSVWSCRECDYDQCGKCMSEKLEVEKKSSDEPLPDNQPGASKAGPSSVPHSNGSTAAAEHPTLAADHEEQSKQRKMSTCSSKEDVCVPPIPDVSDAGCIKKARDDALARKRAIEERMAADAAALAEEESRLDEIRKKLGEADKVRQHSESMRSAIELQKREIRRLERENERAKDMVKQAEEAARHASTAQVNCETQLKAKREHCQKLEEEMVEFLEQVRKDAEKEKADELADAEASEQRQASKQSEAERQASKQSDAEERIVSKDSAAAEERPAPEESATNGYHGDTPPNADPQQSEAGSSSIEAAQSPSPEEAVVPPPPPQ